MSPTTAGPERNMFTTFQGLSQPRNNEPQEAVKQSPKSASKRITTPHACAECKRRKIRCDGRQPCGQCVGCRSPKPCYYDKHRQRVIPSRKTLDALTQSLEECRSVLRRLYPTRDPQSLLNLSRQELVSILDRPTTTGVPSKTSPSGSHTSPTSTEFRSPVTITDDDRSLANLEQIPSQDTEWDEERRNRDPIPAEADDVNALSLSVDRQSSYLGATSIKAAFLVMLKVAPILRSFLAPPSNGTKPAALGNNHAPLQQVGNNSAMNLVAIPWTSGGQTLIDAYFSRVQIFVPMLDEPSFRADYLSGRRHDAPWLALLNIVFPMGSIVANKSDDHNHINFYNKAKDHLGIDSFGSGHIETLQALSLMGGYYLHYINRPNMANAITGAALRMACAMGLHRETPIDQNNANTMVAEQRRRTWWSLFCLDTWASTTLGRPSMGRWGHGITQPPPEGILDSNVTGQNNGIIPLIENIKFCKIATQTQDALAISPVLRAEDRANLDGQLTQWYRSLPWILRSTEPCPESIYTARCVMKWRYQNLRIVLHRPVLLNLANRSTTNTNTTNIPSSPPYKPSKEDLSALATCRAVSKQTIEDIAHEWKTNQMLGWNGVWFLYQASMIPLVSIFWEHWNEKEVVEWRHQIEIVLEAMEGMAEWSLAARRSREVVLKMYEASRQRADGTFMGEDGSDGASLARNTVGNDHSMDSDIRTRQYRQPNHPTSNSIHSHTHAHTSNDHSNEMAIDNHNNSMTNEEAAAAEQQQNLNLWDLDGMLWGNLPDGLDMPFDGMPFGFEDGLNATGGEGGGGWGQGL